MAGKPWVKASPIHVSYEYSAKDTERYIAAMARLVFLFVAVGVAGALDLIALVVCWARDHEWPGWWWLGVPLGVAAIFASYFGVALVNRAPEERERPWDAVEAQTGRAQPAPAPEPERTWIQGAQVDARLEELKRAVKETQELLAAVRASQPEMEVLPVAPQAAPARVQVAGAPTVELAARQIEERKQPALPEPKRALPAVPAGLTRRQWRTLLCDIKERRNTTYARIQEVCGIGHSRAETVREALVQAGICRKGEGNRPQLEMVEDYEAAIRAEIDRLEGAISIPFQPEARETVPVHDLGTPAKQGIAAE